MASPAVAVCTWGHGSEPPGAPVEEALALGRRVRDQLGGELSWLVLGPLPADASAVAGRCGAARVDHIASPRLETFAADVWVEALAHYCRVNTPFALLFSQTYDTRLVAPRLAGRLGGSVLTNVVNVAAVEGHLTVTASAYGGDTRAEYVMAGAQPYIVTVVAGAAASVDVPSRSTAVEIRELCADLEGVEERIRVVQRPHAEGPRLEDAEIVVAGGRGLGSPTNYQLIERLAEALGGLPAASRPIVDDGWTDASRQVGLTGKVTRPSLYVAVGVSGASQHMAGCSAAKTIVAINRDRNAAIFRHARFGIVGDCVTILPELIRAVRER